MNNNNANNSTQNSTQNNIQNNAAEHARYEEILTFVCRPRSSLPRKFAEYVKKEKEADEEQGRLTVEYGSVTDIPTAFWTDLMVMREELGALRVSLAKSLFKRDSIAALFDSVYHLAVFLDAYAGSLFDSIAEVKAKTAPKATAKADAEILAYLDALTEGKALRSDNFAKALKEAGLLISYRRGQSDNLLEFTNIDAALNKVYAAARRQAKKNGLELAKSNKVTKDAAKAEVLGILLRMVENHEYEFEVIIGETANK